MSSTKIIKIDISNPQEEHLREAGRKIERGGLVIIPTETVYGIAVNSLNKKAIDRLYRIKNRPKDKPFSLLIDSKEKIEVFAKDIPVSAYKLIERFWPGALTLILTAKSGGTVGLRMPDDKIAQRIIAMSKVPVACPSANLSGKGAPVNFGDAIRDLDGLVDMALDAGETRLKSESSIVDLTVQPMQIIRESAIKKEDIEAAVNKKIVLFVCTGNSCRSVMAQALLKKKLQEEGRSDIEVLSAGLMMLGGLEATAETQELLRKEGIDVSGHHSRRVTSEMLKKSDIILVMEKLHEGRILQIAPEVKNRLFLLKEFAKINDDNLDIADPIGKDMGFYSPTFALIKEAVERVSKII